MIIVDVMTIVARQPLAGEQGKLSDLQSCCPWKCLFIIRKNVMMMMVKKTGCTQIPISTLSHIWVFVRLYGIVFVIIVIIIIIIMIIKSEGVNAQL